MSKAKESAGRQNLQAARLPSPLRSEDHSNELGGKDHDEDRGGQGEQGDCRIYLHTKDD